MKPDYIAPVVGFLASDNCDFSGTLYEVFGGYCAQVRWQRTYGYVVWDVRSVALTLQCLLPQ